MRLMRRTWTLACLVVLFVLALAACASCLLLPRYPSAAPRNQVWPDEKLTKSMNPWFLGDGFSDRIEIEVDWVEGCRPGPHTIEALRAIAGKYAPRGVPVAVTLDDEIPRSEWDATKNRERGRVDPLVAKHADFAREPCDPDFRTAHLYILFAPGSGPWYFGYSNSWYVEGEGSTPVDGIVVFHDAHARLAKLWLSCDRMEAMTLIHEYGHHLGLVANGTHERTGHFGGHCTELTCLMAQPTWRVYARNALGGLFNHFPSDYCARCQDDIGRSQKAWRERLAREPDYRTSRAEAIKAQYWSLGIHPLVEKGEYASALAEIEAARHRFPESSSLAHDEVLCLAAVGRFDDATLRLAIADPDQRPRLRNTVGRYLILAGRNADAIALFDRNELRKLEDYEFQQSAIILKRALENAHRWDEAIALTDEMLARPAISFLPEIMRVRRADLLLHAGRTAEASSAVEKGLGSKKTRGYWYRTAADLDAALGRHDEARSLLREWLEHEKTLQGKENGAMSEPHWRRLWSIAEIHARLGEVADAQAVIADKSSVPPDHTDHDSILSVEVPVLARLAEWDRAAELVRHRDPESWFDVCGDRDLAPMRSNPRYTDLFAKCSPPSVR